MEIEMINCNCLSRQLSEDVQEYYDKMYGRPSTDMYDFVTLTEDELIEKNIIYGWKSKKKENITEDQKTKRICTEYLGWGYNRSNTDTDNIVVDNNFIDQVIEEVKTNCNNTLLKEITKYENT